MSENASTRGRGQSRSCRGRGIGAELEPPRAARILQSRSAVRPGGCVARSPSRQSLVDPLGRASSTRSHSSTRSVQVDPLRSNDESGLDEDSLSRLGRGAGSTPDPTPPWTWRQAVTYKKASAWWGLVDLPRSPLQPVSWLRLYASIRINIPRRAVRALFPRSVRQVFWWLIRAFAYLLIFGIAIDFATNFSESPRATRTATVGIAVVAASIHPLVKRRLRRGRRADSTRAGESGTRTGR